MPREGHEHLSGEMPRNHEYQMILMIVFFIIWILDSFLIRWTIFAAPCIPFWVTIPPAVIILAFGAYLMDRSHKDLFHVYEPVLVTEGIFSKTRHPMYLGTVLFYTGLAFQTLSFISLGFCLILSIAYKKFANYEEMLLEEKFGDEFLQYKEEVPKWMI